MNRLLKRIAAIMLTMAVVCMIGCKKTDHPNNGGNNGNNGGNGGETPEAPAIVSTSEVQFDGTVFIEAVFEDESKMYFAIISPTELSVANGEFFYQDNPSLAYKYRGEVIIPETITHLGTTYTVVAIGYKAFLGCSLVTSVKIPNPVRFIYGYKNFNIPYSDYIGAFGGCINLLEINIDNVEHIGDNSFIGCLCYSETVTIPNRVKSIGKNAFNAKDIIFNADSCLTAGGWEYSENNVFSDIIYYSSFPYMESICFGNSIKTIPQYICYGHGISQIDIPNSVISIGERAFAKCERITEITLPSSIRQIFEYAFDANQIVTNISCLATNLPILGNNVFGNRSVQLIRVPMSSVEAYKTADGWSEYADVIVGI